MFLMRDFKDNRTRTNYFGLLDFLEQLNTKLKSRHKLTIVRPNKNDIFFTVKDHKGVRLLNVEKDKYNNVIIKWYPFLDMSLGKNWGVREYEYATYKTETVRKFTKLQFFGTNSTIYNVHTHRETDTTLSVMNLNEFEMEELRTITLMTLLAHDEQFEVRNKRKNRV